MALIKLHKIMIATALAFCALFAVRSFVVGAPVIGGTFVLVTVGLGAYFSWFLKNKQVALAEE